MRLAAARPNLVKELLITGSPLPRHWIYHLRVGAGKGGEGVGKGKEEKKGARGGKGKGRGGTGTAVKSLVTGL